MFWQTQNSIDRSRDAYLREELRQRLRLVADFATLGAYELTDAPAHGDTPHAAGGEPTQRVFLFTRAPQSHCKAGREAVRECPTTADRHIARHSRPATRRRVARRRGGVAAAQQPCTVSAVETVAGRPAR
ncbi:MAG TPA: hypothetical protein VFB51_06160 [Solirubrobacterales bacterium]|nr:hypothetical protein [Solirubrobacterales bacterium]